MTEPMIRWHGAGTPLILVHGWLLGAEWLAPLRERLETQYRVGVVNLPGHGGAPGGYWTPAGIAASVCEALAGPAVWVGWSLGAQVVIEAALREPAAVSGGGLVAASPCFGQRADWPRGQSDTDLRAMVHRLRRAPHRTAVDFARALDVSADFPRNAFDPPRVDALVAGLEALRENDYRASLAMIEAPLTWVVGRADPLVPVAAAEWAATRGRGRCAVLDGAGHLPFPHHTTALLAALDFGAVAERPEENV